MKDECASFNYPASYVEQNRKNDQLETDKIPEIKCLTAKNKLESVREQLQNKIQAQEALQKSLKPDSKVLQNISDEIQSLETETQEQRWTWDVLECQID